MAKLNRRRYKVRLFDRAEIIEVRYNAKKSNWTVERIVYARLLFGYKREMLGITNDESAVFAIVSLRLGNIHHIEDEPV